VSKAVGFVTDYETNLGKAGELIDTVKTSWQAFIKDKQDTYLKYDPYDPQHPVDLPKKTNEVP